ncbi:MAG: outer membrane lipoprotein-sorting protein [Myxococcota bacterium]|nr:outer membrane lipoprotein-sorting protein [Myxococcota bacterium]
MSRRADDNLRSDRTYMEARMTVESPRLSAPRNIRFISWEDRITQRSFIRIREPAKDSGTGFLKLHPNLWMYVPRVERTMRVPPSMMLQSWMGSDFTNDDLVRESSEVEDYDHNLLGIDPALSVAGVPGGTRRALVLEYIPHEEAAVVWGKIIAWIDIETYAPLRQEFYDEDGTKLRELVFSKHKQDGERYVPRRWTLTPLDKKGHATSIELLEMRFDVELDESVFTKRHLQKARER